MRKIWKKFRLYGFKISLKFALIEVRQKIVMQIIKKSYSQNGEDLIIDKLLGYKKNGFYVDIGANDPHRFSNTKRFYGKGWSGINIEPDYNCYKKLVGIRKRDINLNFGIGKTRDKLEFYKLFPDTISTFSKEKANTMIKQGYKLEKIINIETKPLADVLSEYCKGKELDFFSIDAEGLDMDVLKSNDWDKFKPKVICVESYTVTEDNDRYERRYCIESFLADKGYEKVCENDYNSIYLLKLKCKD